AGPSPSRTPGPRVRAARRAPAARHEATRETIAVRRTPAASPSRTGPAGDDRDKAKKSKPKDKSKPTDD
ncbi:MAG: hypothetical protein JWN54_1859, partial [Mycobacterium sp.]|nr:hypothetical protein [Mycobacterium sp.]